MNFHLQDGFRLEFADYNGKMMKKSSAGSIYVI